MLKHNLKISGKLLYLPMSIMKHGISYIASKIQALSNAKRRGREGKSVFIR